MYIRLERIRATIFDWYGSSCSTKFLGCSNRPLVIKASFFQGSHISRVHWQNWSELFRARTTRQASTRWHVFRNFRLVAQCARRRGGRRDEWSSEQCQTEQKNSSFGNFNFNVEQNGDWRRRMSFCRSLLNYFFPKKNYLSKFGVYYGAGYG